MRAPTTLRKIATVRCVCNAGLHHCNGWMHLQPSVAPPCSVGGAHCAPVFSDVTTTLRAGARRVIGATAKPLYPIDGKAGGLDRRSPQTSLVEGGGTTRRWWKEFSNGGSHSRSGNGGKGFRIVGSEKNGSNRAYGDFRFATDGQQAVCLLHDVCKLRVAIPLNPAIGFDIAKQAR